MPYKNNHYVPQLVLRQFSLHPSVYNVRTGEYHKARGTDCIFSQHELYSTEIEQRLGREIESPFANILHQKILKADADSEVVLTRKEVDTIKKFLLIEQLRVASSQEVLEIGQKLQTEVPELTNAFCPFLDENLSETDVRTAWLNDLENILNCKSLAHISVDNQQSNHLKYWAQIYKAGYLAIWDSSKKANIEFVISDIGMTSEREESVFDFGLEYDKKVYLQKQIERNQGNNFAPHYQNLLAIQSSFHENFYMFSVSKNRMLVIINPFFRLYTKREKFPIPTIWPTQIQDKKLFEKNKSPKLLAPLGQQIYRDTDEFRYKIHSMNAEDVLWVNALMLDRIDTFLGFSSLKHAKKSVEFYMNWYKERNLIPPKNYEPLFKLMEKTKGI